MVTELKIAICDLSAEKLQTVAMAKNDILLLDGMELAPHLRILERGSGSAGRLIGQHHSEADANGIVHRHFGGVLAI